MLATGWASLVLWLTGIPLNPMSAALGALTIAIATEFGGDPRRPLPRGARRRARGRRRLCARAYARTGAAVLASGVTAIAGFAVLIASDIQMLRDFGFVTVIDLAVALLGVMVVLPAALVWMERAMKDRYSIVVGLIFLALIVVATVHTLSGGGGEGTLGLDRQPPRWPLPEFAVPGAAGQLEGDANVAQDDCESSPLPCPEDARRDARLPDRHPRRDPRLRPLRPAAGDLVLVHARAARLRRPAGRGRARSTGATVGG